MKKKTTKKKSASAPKSNPKTVGFFCNLPPGVRNEIVRRAKKQDVSQGKIVVDAIKATKDVELFKFDPKGADLVKVDTAAILDKGRPIGTARVTGGIKVTNDGKVVDSKALKRERDRRYRANKKLKASLPAGA